MGVLESKNRCKNKGLLRIDGALGRIRTSDRSVRSRVLYPAELRVHFTSLKLSISAVSRGAYISDLRVKRQVEFAIINKFYYLL